MTKVTLNDIGYVLSSAATINSNNDKIEAAIENTLSRDGASPNEMNAVLDMNSHRILNLPKATQATDPVRLGEVEDIVTGLTGIASGGTVNQVLRKVSSNPYDTGWVTLDKTYIGLGNVDNTSDASKPVSTATQTALDLKAPLASPSLSGAPTAPTAAPGTNTTQLATTAFVAAADALKADLASPALTGTPTAPTAATATNTTQIATTAFVQANKALCQPLDSDLTTIAGLTATTDNFIQSKAGAWASRTVAQVRSDLSATRPAFSAHKNNVDQTFAAGTTTQVTFGTELYDIGSLYASNAWTPPAGLVSLQAMAYCLGTNAAVNDQIFVGIFKNGTAFRWGNAAVLSHTGSLPSSHVSITDNANGTDVYTVWIQYTPASGTPTITIYGAATVTYFMGVSI